MEPQFINRLIHEKSPYLQQHANNPVDWYPWGDEAFSKAKDEDKPIFLSIGYSTCHWCHVMEKESFEDKEIAKFMNESFINVKVDREELPEVDALYMEFSQAIMPSGGGWPLNVFLTPDLMPFFASTYVPKSSSKGFIGFKELLIRLKGLWENLEEKEKLIEQAQKIVDVFEVQTHYKGFEIPLMDEINKALELLYHMEDPIWGGIKGEPKFPMATLISFFLSSAKLNSDSRPLFCAELTLDMMLRGSIFDQLGGGFARYCLDSKWRVPHFEKMLYDNALILRAYLESYSFTKKESYRPVIEKTFKFLIEEMRDLKGVYYSAIDADSEGKEGFYYTWTYDELKEILSNEDFKLFSEYFGISKEGNFEGRNVLFVKQPTEVFCSKRKIDLKTFQHRLQLIMSKLLEIRNKRVKPFIDDKILSSWNSLMIYSLAYGYRVLGDESLLENAKQIFLFIKNQLFINEKLYRRWKDGDFKHFAGLDEYAFTIHAALALYEADGNIDYLKFAIKLTGILQNEFKSDEGAFYSGDGKDTNILLRRIEFYDGAEPSGNAVHCENLLKLYQITFDENYLDQAEDILKASKKHIQQHPAGCCYSLMALNRYWDKNAATIVIALNSKKEHFEDIKNIFFNKYLPHIILIWRFEEDNDLDFESFAPHLKELKSKEGKTTLYLCQRGQCKAFVNKWDDIVEILQDI
jgi:uncharacterized protein YyaL (SSP411 family)